VFEETERSITFLDSKASLLLGLELPIEKLAKVKEIARRPAETLLVKNV